MSQPVHHRIRSTLLALLVFLLLPAWFSPAQRVRSLSREEAYSYFVLNCVRMGEWPGGNDPVTNRKAVIGILGPPGSDLSQALRRTAVSATNSWFAGASIELKESQKVEDLAACHIIFAGATSREERQQAVEFCKDRPILLVSDAADFVKEGGSAGIRVADGKLLFELNLDTLAAAMVELHAQLRAGATAVVKDGRYQSNGRGGDR